MLLARDKMVFGPIFDGVLDPVIAFCTSEELRCLVDF
jgi:hypothetical protein